MYGFNGETIADFLYDLKNALANNISIDRLSLKIDFGFGRNGIKAEEVDELKNLIKFNSLKFLGIFSHLFSATYTDGLEVIKKCIEHILVERLTALTSVNK